MFGSTPSSFWVWASTRPFLLSQAESVQKEKLTRNSGFEKVSYELTQLTYFYGNFAPALIPKMDPSMPSISSALLPVTKRSRLDYEGSDEGGDHDHDLEHRLQMSKALEEANSDLPVGASNYLASEERETLIYSTMIKMHQADMIYKDGQLRERDRTLDSLQIKLASAENRAKLGDWKLTRAEKELAQLWGEVDTLKSQLLLANEKNSMLEEKWKRSSGGGMGPGASSGVTPTTSILTSTHSEIMTKNRENRDSDVRDEAPSSSKVKLEGIPSSVNNEPLSQTVLGAEQEQPEASSAAPPTLPKTKSVVFLLKENIMTRVIREAIDNERRRLQSLRDQKQDDQKLSK